MEYNSRHPLETITHSHALSMLEILIPYVDYSLKLPLALLIKFHEIKLIIHILQSPQQLSQYGLHNTSDSIVDMLGAITGISPEMLNMILSFTENSDGLSSLFSSFGGESSFQDNLSSMLHRMHYSNDKSNSTPFSDSSEDVSTSNPFTSSTDESSSFENTSYSSEDFDTNIARILSEYDLEQASQLSSQ